MSQEKLTFDYSIPKTLQIKLGGDWQISTGFPSINEITLQLAGHTDIRQITFTVSETMKWDSGLVSFLLS